MCTVDGFLIGHPDGPILVDTGMADDHALINEMYQPTCVPIVEALNDAGVDERDLVAIVNTHLHFDHCGQNRSLPDVAVYVQAAEIAAAAVPGFTVPDWAHLDADRLRVVDGDVEIIGGVRLVATPGHTPGHQSVVVDTDVGPEIVVGQCCYTCAEFVDGEPLLGDMHDESMITVGVESLGRLRAMKPKRAHFSHDRTVFSAE